MSQKTLSDRLTELQHYLITNSRTQKEIAEQIEDSIKLPGTIFSNFSTRLAINQSSNFYLP
jgi:hypothetical protein